MYPRAFEPDEALAHRLDAADPLGHYREQFHLPAHTDGNPAVYLCSHSLGLQPKTVRGLMEEELDHWARLGVEGHFHGPTSWYTYQEPLRPQIARLVGAQPAEVVLMNGLTVNLHLLLTSFYRPTPERYKIMVDEPTFPSDLYAVKSQIQNHGYDPADALLTMRPRNSEHTIRDEDVEEFLEERGREVALVLCNGVNFITGQVYDLKRLAEAARRQGCALGLDLAHAIGNVPLHLHDWRVDFAVWCTYKYLSGGPGAIAGCFVHERHSRDLSLPRLAGWWGNDPATRFRMHLQTEFIPHDGAAGWQVSNPSILALVPLRASLALYHEAGMQALRAKSECLTSYLEYLLDRLPGERIELITPRDPARRGCQLSLRVREGGPELLQALVREGVIADFRPPNVLRVAPVPLYNSFHDVWAFVAILARQVA